MKIPSLPMIALALLGALSASPAFAGGAYSGGVHLVSFPGSIGDSKVAGHAGWFTATEVEFPPTDQNVSESSSTHKEKDSGREKTLNTTITLPPGPDAEMLGQQLSRSTPERVTVDVVSSDGKTLESVTLRGVHLKSVENTKAGVRLSLVSTTITRS